MGVPGSGKSTQAKKIANALGFCYLTTGEVLRELAKDDTPLGRQIKETTDKGEFFDDYFVADLIKQRLEKGDCKNGFVSDSYPRHLGQLKIFDPKIEKIFYLKVSDDHAKQRLMARGRIDDTKQLIDKRSELYKEKVEELLEYFKDKIKVIEINGEQDENAVFDQIMEHLDGSHA